MTKNRSDRSSVILDVGDNADTGILLQRDPDTDAAATLASVVAQLEIGDPSDVDPTTIPPGSTDVPTLTRLALGYGSEAATGVRTNDALTLFACLLGLRARAATHEFYGLPTTSARTPFPPRSPFTRYASLEALLIRSKRVGQVTSPLGARDAARVGRSIGRVVESAEAGPVPGAIALAVGLAQEVIAALTRDVAEARVAEAASAAAEALAARTISVWPRYIRTLAPGDDFDKVISDARDRFEEGTINQAALTRFPVMGMFSPTPGALIKAGGLLSLGSLGFTEDEDFWSRFKYEVNWGPSALPFQLADASLLAAARAADSSRVDAFIDALANELKEASSTAGNAPWRRGSYITCGLWSLASLIEDAASALTTSAIAGIKRDEFYATTPPLLTIYGPDGPESGPAVVLGPGQADMTVTGALLDMPAKRISPPAAAYIVDILANGSILNALALYQPKLIADYFDPNATPDARRPVADQLSTVRKMFSPLYPTLPAEAANSYSLRRLFFLSGISDSPVAAMQLSHK
jgi:hypothetical protein